MFTKNNNNMNPKPKRDKNQIFAVIFAFLIILWTVASFCSIASCARDSRKRSSSTITASAQTVEEYENGELIIDFPILKGLTLRSDDNIAGGLTLTGDASLVFRNGYAGFSYDGYTYDFLPTGSIIECVFVNPSAGVATTGEFYIRGDAVNEFSVFIGNWDNISLIWTPATSIGPSSYFEISCTVVFESGVNENLYNFVVTIPLQQQLDFWGLGFRNNLPLGGSYLGASSASVQSFFDNMTSLISSADIYFTCPAYPGILFNDIAFVRDLTGDDDTIRYYVMRSVDDYDEYIVYSDGVWLSSAHSSIYFLNFVPEGEFTASFLTSFNALYDYLMPAIDGIYFGYNGAVVTRTQNAQSFTLTANGFSTADFLKYYYSTPSDNGAVGDSYQRGYGDGYRDGREFGEGLAQEGAYETGKADGIEIGREEGLEEGESIGFGSGFEAGKQTGFDEGYVRGVADSNEYTFMGLFSSVIDAPVQAFTGLFNFDLLGINLSSFFLALLTAGVCLAILRLII